MKSNNIWYLDRGKNFFTEEGIDFFETIIAVINSCGIKNKITSNELIEKFPNKYKNVGNPNALLTTVRNIGFIDKNNCLAENVKYYLDYKLTYKELIFENLSKVNYDKDGEVCVKPLFIICMFLYQLFNIDENYAFITKKDCKDFLYDVIEYNEKEIFEKTQKIILRDRDYSNVSDPVLDIWFNALQEIEVFEKTENKNILKINKDEINFFKFIYEQCRNKEPKLFVDGIISLIPDVLIKDDVNINDKELFEYLFGINNNINNFCENDYFGIYNAFRKIPNIAIRKIESNNSNAAEKLYGYVYRDNHQNVIEKKEEKKYVCPQCGGELGFKKGRYGTFIACSNYPDCKYTKSINQKK